MLSPIIILSILKIPPKHMLVLFWSSFQVHRRDRLHYFTKRHKHRFLISVISQNILNARLMLNHEVQAFYCYLCTSHINAVILGLYVFCVLVYMFVHLLFHQMPSGVYHFELYWHL